MHSDDVACLQMWWADQQQCPLPAEMRWWGYFWPMQLPRLVSIGEWPPQNLSRIPAEVRVWFLNIFKDQIRTTTPDAAAKSHNFLYYCSQQAFVCICCKSRQGNRRCSFRNHSPCNRTCLSIRYCLCIAAAVSYRAL